jgi:hypothetical protein
MYTFEVAGLFLLMERAIMKRSMTHLVPSSLLLLRFVLIPPSPPCVCFEFHFHSTFIPSFLTRFPFGQI